MLRLESNESSNHQGTTMPSAAEGVARVLFSFDPSLCGASGHHYDRRLHGLTILVEQGLFLALDQCWTSSSN